MIVQLYQNDFSRYKEWATLWVARGYSVSGFLEIVDVQAHGSAVVDFGFDFGLLTWGQV